MPSDPFDIGRRVEVEEDALVVDRDLLDARGILAERVVERLAVPEGRDVPCDGGREQGGMAASVPELGHADGPPGGEEGAHRVEANRGVVHGPDQGVPPVRQLSESPLDASRASAFPVGVHHDRGEGGGGRPQAVRLGSQDHDDRVAPGLPGRPRDAGERGFPRQPDQGLGLAQARGRSCREDEDAVHPPTNPGGPQKTFGPPRVRRVGREPRNIARRLAPTVNHVGPAVAPAAVVLLLLAGCSGDLPQATALDVLPVAEGRAVAWDSKAQLLTVVGMEGAFPAAGAPFSQHGQGSTRSPPPYWERMSEDPRVGDGRCEFWILRYGSPPLGQVLRLVVGRDGNVLEQEYADFQADEQPVGEWRVDSDAAVRIAKNANPNLRTGVESENFFLVMVLHRESGDANARWTVGGGGGDPSGGGGGQVEVDATTGEVLKTKDEVGD